MSSNALQPIVPPTLVQSARPATADEILTSIGKLLVAFELYGDPHEEARIALLAESVQGEPLWAIRRAVNDFAFGKVPRKRHVFPPAFEFAPHVARIAEAAARPVVGQGRCYSYRPPRSAIIQRDCTKPFAQRLVNERMFPSGSIWCPGSVGDRPDIGDLYGPDGGWEGPKLILTKEEAAAVAANSNSPAHFD